jgi:predicted dehydrogenase
MLAQEELDAVVIATPPNTHAEFAIAAAERGLHILLEKPMATTVRECDEIIRALDQRKTVLTLSHEKRFSPGFEEIKRIIDKEHLVRSFTW